MQRADSRAAAVRRHQDAVLADLVNEKESKIGDKQLPISDDRGVAPRVRDGYKVKEDATHVTRIRTSSESKSVMMDFCKQLFAGGGAGAITKTAVAPLERTKILLQVQGMKSLGKDKSEFKYKGVMGTMRTVVQEEGFLALYAGNGANVLRVIPVYALKFSFNEQFKDMVRTPGQDLNFSQLIMAGTMAGLFQTCVTYPLETVRTRLTLGAGLGAKYNGIVDVLRQTVRQEGFRGLYKGIGPTFLSGSPYVGLQMTFYEIFKRNFQRLAPDAGPGLKQLEIIVAGATAGIIAQTITYPGDTIRRRMQMNGMGGEAKVYSNSWDCAVKLCRAEGVMGLFNGLRANLIRAIPGAAIQFAAFEFLNDLVNKKI